jgi:hypothetical protein
MSPSDAIRQPQESSYGGSDIEMKHARSLLHVAVIEPECLERAAICVSQLRYVKALAHLFPMSVSGLRTSR